jgi:hypothetical protein
VPSWRDPMIATAAIASALIGLLVGAVLVSRRQQGWLLAEMRVSPRGGGGTGCGRVWRVGQATAGARADYLCQDADSGTVAVAWRQLVIAPDLVPGFALAPAVTSPALRHRASLVLAPSADGESPPKYHRLPHTRPLPPTHPPPSVHQRGPG